MEVLVPPTSDAV